MLAFACAFTMFAGAAFTDQADIEAAEAVDMLTALGVIDGYEDGSFQPNETVTRAEMAKMIYTIRNGGNATVTQYEGYKTPFADVENTGHWAKGYIAYCYANGIIDGKSATSFDPDATVTGTEAAKMALVLIGYDAERAGLEGSSWTTNTINLATQKDLFKDFSISITGGCDRQYAAQLLYNTLWACTVRWSSDAESYQDVVEYDHSDDGVTAKPLNVTVAKRYMGLEELVGTYHGNDKVTGVLEGRISVGWNTTALAPYTATYDLGLEWLGEEVKVLYKESKDGVEGLDVKDTVFGVYNTGETTVYNITKGDLQDAGANTANGKIKFGDKTYEVANLDAYATDYEAIITNFGAGTVDNNALDGTAGGIDTADAADWANYINDNLRVNSTDSIKFVCDDSGKINRAYVENWAYSKLISKTSDKVQLEGVGSRDLEDVTFEGDIEVDSLVAWADFYSTNETMIKAASTISGKVTAVRSDNEIQIDGNWYKASANAETLSDYRDDLQYTVGDSYEIVLDGDKYHVAGKVVEADTDFAMILKADRGLNDQVKLLLADGTEKTFIINSDSAIQYGDAVDTVDIDDTLGAATAVLVKYELVKEGTEVKMTAVSAMEDDAASAGPPAIDSTTHTFDKNTKVLTMYQDPTPAGEDVATKYIATDNAVAFVYVGGAQNKWKVYSANTISNFSATDNSKAQYSLDDGKVEAFALIGAAFPTGAGDATGYGYVTDVQYTENDGGDNIVNLTVWNGSEDYTIIVDGSTSPAAKGDFVKYPITTAAVGTGDVVKADDTTTTFTAVKVKEYDTDRNLVITTTGTYSVSGTIVNDVESVYKVDSDTQIIGVKTADKEGSSYNKITPFSKVSGQDYKNAYILSENDNGTQVIKAIFVDEDNKLVQSDGTIGGNAGAPFNVTAAADVTGAVNGQTLTVTTDKTRVIKDETITYTVTVSGNATADGKLTITAGTNSAVVVNGATVVSGDATAFDGSNVNFDTGEGNGAVIKFTVTADGNGAVGAPTLVFSPTHAA